MIKRRFLSAVVEGVGTPLQPPSKYLGKKQGERLVNPLKKISLLIGEDILS